MKSQNPMSTCFIESKNFFFLKKTNRKQNQKREKINFLPTPQHFIHALSSMYSIYNAKKKYEEYLPPQGERYAGEVKFITSVVLFNIS